MRAGLGLTALAAALTVSSGMAIADDHKSGMMDMIERSDLLQMFDGVTFDTWAAGVYVHRFDESSDNNLGTGYFSHPNANTFEFNQAWLAIDKAPTESSRGGYHLDIVYGAIAGAQRGNSVSGGDDPLIYTAYVSYLADIGSGVQFDMGRVGTLLGAEVLQTTDNFNVTRGLVYGLQPITHTGVIASTEFGDGFSGAFGIVNDLYSDSIADTSSQKVVTGQVSWSGDNVYAGLSAIYGRDDSLVSAGGVSSCNPNGDCQLGVIDFLLTSDISDDFSVWLNADYLFNQGDDQSEEGSAYGIGIAGRLALSDRAGIAARFEYISFDEEFLAASAGVAQSAIADDFDQFALTGTFDYALTDQLTFRTEIRYDDASDPIFADDMGGFGEDSQITGLVEVIFNLRK